MLFQFPMDNFDCDSEKAKRILPSYCLENDWQCPGEAVRGDETGLIKALTFMASKSRLDDKRMVKVKRREDGKFEVGHFSALDRERMLGFPEGYVSGAGMSSCLSLLFKSFYLKWLTGFCLPCFVS